MVPFAVNTAFADSLIDVADKTWIEKSHHVIRLVLL
jgi:hypothetical protein